MPSYRNHRAGYSSLAALALALLAGPVTPALAADPLVNGEMLTPSGAGATRNAGSFPVNIVADPAGRFAFTTDSGFRESIRAYRLSDGVQTGQVDFNPGPGDRGRPSVGLYYGLAVAPNADGTETVYASQGAQGRVAVLSVSAEGKLEKTSTIALSGPGDIVAGIALDHGGHLFAAVNETPVDHVGTVNASGLGSLAMMGGALAVIDLASGKEIGRCALPGPVARTSSYPFAAAALNDGRKVYVGSQRDGTVFVVDTREAAAPRLASSIATGSHPVALLLDRSQARLYVGNAGSDTVTVVDTAADKVSKTFPLTAAGAGPEGGATPDGLGLSRDEKTLYVALGDLNAVAAVDTGSGRLRGLIPVGWYPTGVAVGANGALLVANAKGNATRNPNPGLLKDSRGQYILNIIEGNVQLIADPAKAVATRTVRANNRGTGGRNPLARLRLPSKIKHVIYIVKENRTYDQVFGDLPQGNGDPKLTLFGAKVTPNEHALASRFVLLDNLYACGDVSGDGWVWSTEGIANEYVVKNVPNNYSSRGKGYDFEGANDDYPVGGLPASDPDGKPLSEAFPGGLPPIADAGAAPGGHLWDVVRKAGLTYRNYGFFLTFGIDGAIPDNYPAASGVQPPGHDLAGITDIDYRAFDLDYPDSDYALPAAVRDSIRNLVPRYGKHDAGSRIAEWKTEFAEMLKADPTGGSVPSLMTVRLGNDHTSGTRANVRSPRALVADNDYAVGELVDTISHSPIWKSTAIFVIEDDAQNGADHVDAHRTTAMVISPYIKRGSVDHTFYNTDSVLRTMEIIVGVGPMSHYDAMATPILDWSSDPDNGAPYDAVAEDQAIITEVNPDLSSMRPGTTAYRLALAAEHMDLTHPDSAPTDLINEMIWKSVKGMSSPVPAPRHTLTRVRDVDLDGDGE